MAATGTGRVRWEFLHSASADLTWYIGSSLAGWLYVALVLALGKGLSDPVRDPFAHLELLGASIPLTLGLLVVASWAILIDAPHVFATLARTWLDPDDWRERRSILLVSTGRPEEAALGSKVAATLFLGWAMQHYYLDSKIWRVRRDPALGTHLRLS